jgi:hypothetical protein
MSLTSLIAGIRKASIDSIELDASVEELHQSRARVTKHPVEEGADVGDHVVPEPDGLRITGLVSNHPIDVFDFETGTQDGRAETAYGQLLYLMNEKQPITVVTTLNTYDDMIIESVEVPRNARLGNTVRFSATLTALRRVKSETVDAPEPEAKTARAKPRANRGKQPLKPATEAQSTSFSSKALGVGA